MKSLYITSIESFSGKTATCLALGKRFQADGYRVGYLKPLSVQPWLTAGKIADEDAAFVSETLGITTPVWELSPVVVTPEFLKAVIRGEIKENLLHKIEKAAENARSGKDILLVEGGGSLGEGYAVGLPTPEVARAIGCCVLAIVKYFNNIRLLDDVLSIKAGVGGLPMGVIVNRVPGEAITFVNDLAVPFLEKTGVPVFGVIPEISSLAALTVGEVVELLEAEVLTDKINPLAIVETLTVGAMTAETALHIFRKQTNKAVITGGDRTDIQLAALETSTACLILTGNLHPNPLIVKQAEAQGVAILLVPTNTMETVETIEHVFGKTHLAQPAKLAQFRELVNKHVDIERLYQAMKLS